MSDLQTFTAGGSQRFLLPYGSAVVFSGAGEFVYGQDGKKSRRTLRATQQSIGPFRYDMQCEITADGVVHYEVFDLQSISLERLNTLKTLPFSTRAWVTDGATCSDMYWTGKVWQVFSMQAGSLAGPVQRISPIAEGATVAADDAQLNASVLLDPSGPRTAVSLVMPTTPRDGQIMTIASTKMIASLTFQPAIPSSPGLWDIEDAFQFKWFTNLSKWVLLK